MSADTIESIESIEVVSRGPSVDHTCPLGDMSGKAMLHEYKYLLSGAADTRERGVSCGLPEQLKQRLAAIEVYVERAINNY